MFNILLIIAGILEYVLLGIDYKDNIQNTYLGGILIAVAFAIATPIAWYYMHQWLQAYVYRINISWWLFAAGGFGATIIALATISFQAIKAAKANPVKSLRSE